MTDGAFAARAQRYLGHRINRDGKQATRLRNQLPAANNTSLPHEYLAVAIAASILAAAGALIVGALLIGVSYPGETVAILVGSLVVAAIGGGLTYTTYLFLPYLIASERGSNIDDNLPFALQYMSATSGAGTSLDAVLKRASQQGVYGEFAVEMGRLRRDMALLGLERTAAIEAAILRCPSERLKEVLQGLASTLSAGGSVPIYLESKAEELLQLHASRQRKALENLGLLSEVFIVVAVALPLLLVIMLVALALFGQAPGEVIRTGFRLFTVLVPALYAAFIGAMVIYKPPT